MKSDEILLTARGIARRFGIPVTWIMVEAEAGRLPHLCIGRLRLFNTKAVRQALLRAAAFPPKETDR
jgi:hypothetical protein